jgi:chromosome segregation ATPase
MEQLLTVPASSQILLQDDVIIGQQRALSDHTANTEYKLRDLENLNERVSRLVLDRGLMKAELSKTRSEVKDLMTAAEKTAKERDDLAAIIESLEAAKHDPEQTIELLRADLEASNKARAKAEQQAGQLQKDLNVEKHERHRAQALVDDANAKLVQSVQECNRISDLYDGQLAKYKLQSSEFAHYYQVILVEVHQSTASNITCFQDSLDANKDVKALKTVVAALQQETKVQKVKADRMEAVATELKSEKAELKSETAKLRLHLEKAEAERDENGCKHAAAIVRLSREKFALQETNTKFQETNTKFQEANTKLQETNSKLKEALILTGELAALQEKNAKLEKDYLSVVAETAVLQEENAKLEKEYRLQVMRRILHAVRDQLDCMNADLTYLQEDPSALKATNQALKAELAETKMLAGKAAEYKEFAEVCLPLTILGLVILLILRFTTRMR